MAGHYGTEGTYTLVAKNYYWIGMRKYITDNVKNCPDCFICKASNQKPLGLLQTPVPDQRFETLAIDLFGPLPESKDGKRWILIIEDCTTKWVELFALPNATAKECAITLIEEVLLRLHGSYKNCDRYKNDPDSVHELANLIIEERKYDESQQLELEKIREKSKLDLEIARIRANDKDNNTEVNCNDSSSLNSLIKSIRTLTVKIPDKPGGWSFFFLSLERAFSAKSVSDKFKPEILLNLLGEKAANIIIYLKDEDLKNNDKIKSIILKEFEPTPQSCLQNFKKATRQNCESHVQFAS
ncbi:integrase_H2C2 domain-containing protein [Trichonephila clavipes]|nr:integrase_H2C2 domain-containing protein [Trichonephila clavipes]